MSSRWISTSFSAGAARCERIDLGMRRLDQRRLAHAARAPQQRVVGRQAAGEALGVLASAASRTRSMPRSSASSTRLTRATGERRARRRARRTRRRRRNRGRRRRRGEALQRLGDAGEGRAEVGGGRRGGKRLRHRWRLVGWRRSVWHRRRPSSSAAARPVGRRSKICKILGKRARSAIPQINPEKPQSFQRRFSGPANISKTIFGRIEENQRLAGEKIWIRVFLPFRWGRGRFPAVSISSPAIGGASMFCLAEAGRATPQSPVIPRPPLLY